MNETAKVQIQRKTKTTHKCSTRLKGKIPKTYSNKSLNEKKKNAKLIPEMNF